MKKTFAALATTLAFAAAVPVADAAVPQQRVLGITMPHITTNKPELQGIALVSTVTPAPLPAPVAGP